MNEELSRLEAVELREVWTDEAQDFTPWLAKAENLRILGETLNMELELEAQEVDVGDFRADILCKTDNDSWVLIENQLEETNHKHLGQILTYAAGLDAKTVIWIAKKFRDEHRAALDRLNETTDDEFRYFGVEIKLWQIGDSARAPQFHIICGPNNWSKDMHSTDWSKDMHSTVGKDISGSKLRQRKYWSIFHDYMKEKGSHIVLPGPKAKHYLEIRIGTADTPIRAWVYKNECIGVTLNIGHKNARTFFNLLMKQRDEIENLIGEPLEWEEKPNQKDSRITLRKENTDPTNETDWRNQHEWLASKVELFHEIFKPRIDKLKNANYQPEDVNIE